MVNKTDIELNALGLILGVPSSNKLSLLPELCQGSILGSQSPPGSPTVTTLGCHCVETASSPLPPNSGIQSLSDLSVLFVLSQDSLRIQNWYF